MGKVIESVDVAVPVHTAYNQWTQFETFPQFMEGVQEIRQVSDTMTHWVIDIGGVHREFDAKITEQHPDERVAWTSIDGPKHAGVVTFHRLDDTHSRVTAQLDIDPEGFVETVADKAGVVDRIVKADLARFREFIEHRGAETGAWRGDVPSPDAAGTATATTPTTTTPTAERTTPLPGSWIAPGSAPGTATRSPDTPPTPGAMTPGIQAIPDPDDYNRPL